MSEDTETIDDAEAIDDAEITFTDLKLDPEIISVLDEKGYQSPTTIQRMAIPYFLDGRDIIGSAPTGTGKTAAFALPMLCMLKSAKGIRGLILVPTRELASQCEDNFKTYGQHLNLKITVIYGGVGYNKQIQELEDGPDIVIATPGRLIDHWNNKRLNFDKLQMLVLDEVDRMLDMGFIDDVRSIIKMCPKNRQTLLFSATVPDSIKRLANWALNDPVAVDAGARRMPAETIDHSIYPIDAMQKPDLLLAILREIEFESILVFTRTKRDADRVSEWLIGHHFAVTTMHADRSQREREQALKGFKNGKFKILVATDVASRGLDISGISHVINFNVPERAQCPVRGLAIIPSR